MCGEGVVAKIFVGDETHGVAEIEFGDVPRKRAGSASLLLNSNVKPKIVRYG